MTNRPFAEKANTYGPPVAELCYDAAAERLYGSVGVFKVNQLVYSGGSRGHTILPEDDERTAQRAKDFLYHEESELKSRLSNTRMISDSSNGKKTMIQRGGTLPPGKYRCSYTFKPNLGGECIFLDRDAGVAGEVINSPFASFPIPHHRTNSFFIHKYGKMGSDGCLVFPQNAEFIRLSLNHAIKNFPGLVRLTVINASYLLPAERGGRNA